MNMALLWKTLFGLFYEGFPVRVQLEAYVTYSCTVDLYLEAISDKKKLCAKYVMHEKNYKLFIHIIENS
jgi:hypothetical protein